MKHTILPTRTTHCGATLTELGLGGAQFGNLHQEMSNEDAERIVDAAWTLGIRVFDTAPHYGMGLSERRLGAALAKYPRDDYVLSTKVGRLIVPNVDHEDIDDEFYLVPKTTKRVWDFSADGVHRSLEASLERLNMDRIDLVYMHDPDDHWDEAIAGAVPALQDLRAQGVIQGFGAGMNQSRMLERFIREGDADVVMIAGRYSLFEQGSLDDVLPAATAHDANAIIAGAYNSGLLSSPRPSPGARYNYVPAPPEVLERVNRIADICEAHGVTLPEAALAFPLMHPSVAAIVVGAGHPSHIETSVQRVNTPVPQQLWTELIAAGLLRPDAPTGQPFDV